MGIARLDLAYHGGRFAGWETQAGQRTVQAALESALEQILGEPVALTVAGRTDAGVHATGQVASFEYSGKLPDSLANRLNGVLPRDIAVTAAAPDGDDFDARRSALARVYRYRVLASPVRDPFEQGRALWWRYPLDLGAMEQAAAAVVGKHDLTAFTPTRSAHSIFERNIDACSWEAEPRRPAVAGATMLVLSVEAPAFMRSQVRVMVGTMLEVGGGRRSLDDFRSLLEGAPRERAGDTAPAHGLYLVGVRY
jgi:tRNA pseudouridine38-40 synthase